VFIALREPQVRTTINAALHLLAHYFTLKNIALPNFFFSFRARPKATMT